MGSSQNHYEDWENQAQSWVARNNAQKCAAETALVRRLLLLTLLSMPGSAPFLRHSHSHCPGNLIWPQLPCCKRENWLLSRLLCVTSSPLKAVQVCLVCQSRSCTWIQGCKGGGPRADGKVFYSFYQFLDSENQVLLSSKSHKSVNSPRSETRPPSNNSNNNNQQKKMFVTALRRQWFTK